MKAYFRTDAWIAKLSKMKHMKSVLFVTAFLEATVSPILPEVLLLVVLSYRKDISWKLLSAISALGSAVGALVMYLLGSFLYTSYGPRILQALNGEVVAEKARNLFEQNSFVAQFFASLTPLPDRVFSFLAGAFSVSIITIFIATFLGRLVRASVVAYLAYEYGDEARVYIKKHTKTAAVILLLIVLIYVVHKVW